MPWFNIELDEKLSKEFKSRVIQEYGQLRGNVNKAFAKSIGRDILVKDILVRMVDRGLDKTSMGEALTKMLLLYEPPKKDKKETEI